VRLRFALVAVLAATPVLGAGEVTPLNANIREGTELFVTCALTEAPRLVDIPVFRTPVAAEEAKGIYHYRLWVPPGYLAQPARRWPCVFIASPGGNARMGNMAERLKAGGYIVVMLVESRNGPWQPTIGNFLAAHDDVTKRLRVDEQHKIATGFSGGARAASIFVQIRSGFCGLIMQSEGVALNDATTYFTEGLLRNRSVFIAMTMGRADPRMSELRQMTTRLDPARFLFLNFPGAHQWAPADTFGQALSWVESHCRH
jgi:predicted esterase